MSQTPEQARSWLIENGEMTLDEAGRVTAAEPERRERADRVRDNLLELGRFRAGREHRT